MAGCESKLEDLGSYPLKGFGEPVTVFALSTGEVAGNHPARYFREYGN
jgi:class 3 adenylate cyclase